ncbi:aspartate/glutamate racemase [Enterobacterales bacterium CwR94]|nr:aspartate/glutamate racemase [Enterobacterales bacterium CwR94]
MKVIGLIGGMSWESTALYYQWINQQVKHQLGGLHSARLVLWSVDFQQIERLQVAGQWQEAGELLAEAGRHLEAAGAEMVVLCTNTMHKVAPQIAGAITIPFIHIADATANALLKAGARNVGLLGTRFTMEQDFYRARLVEAGLNVLVPEEDDRAQVHRIIYDELCLGDIRDASRQIYREVMQRLVDKGADAIIMGCTEITLLVNQQDARVPLFDTTRLHADAAVAFALSKTGS